MHERLSSHLAGPFWRWAEIVTNECTSCARVRGRSKGKKKEWNIESYEIISRLIEFKKREGQGKQRRNGPLAFISRVHPLINSCTSSGPTSFRSQASVHCGFAGSLDVTPLRLEFFLEPPSLLRNTRAKKDMVRDIRRRNSTTDKHYKRRLQKKGRVHVTASEGQRKKVEVEQRRAPSQQWVFYFFARQH